LVLKHSISYSLKAEYITNTHYIVGSTWSLKTPLTFLYLNLLLTQAQNQIIYLMFLNGILFLGLNFIAYSIVFPGPKGSKRIGYLFISCGLMAYLAQLMYQGLLALDYPSSNINGLLLSGFVAPVFFISLFYYRIKRNRIEKNEPLATDKKTDETH
jgi:bacteriorhodopsin